MKKKEMLMIHQSFLLGMEQRRPGLSREDRACREACYRFLLFVAVFLFVGALLIALALTFRTQALLDAAPVSLKLTPTTNEVNYAE